MHSHLLTQLAFTMNRRATSTFSMRTLRAETTIFRTTSRRISVRRSALAPRAPPRRRASFFVRRPAPQHPQRHEPRDHDVWRVAPAFPIYRPPCLTHARCSPAPLFSPSQRSRRRRGSALTCALPNALTDWTPHSPLLPLCAQKAVEECKYRMSRYSVTPNVRALRSAECRVRNC